MIKRLRWTIYKAAEDLKISDVTVRYWLKQFKWIKSRLGSNRVRYLVEAEVEELRRLKDFMNAYHISATGVSKMWREGILYDMLEISGF